MQIVCLLLVLRIKIKKKITLSDNKTFLFTIYLTWLKNNETYWDQIQNRVLPKTSEYLKKIKFFNWFRTQLLVKINQQILRFLTIQKIDILSRKKSFLWSFPIRISIKKLILIILWVLLRSGRSLFFQFLFYHHSDRIGRLGFGTTSYLPSVILKIEKKKQKKNNGQRTN